MPGLRQLLDRAGRLFGPGGRFERLHPLYEAMDTFFYAPGDVTRTGAHVRDAMDLKRMMILVVLAAMPCVFMAMYNTGLQANQVIEPSEVDALTGWRHALLQLLSFGYDAGSFWDNLAHGAMYFLPLYVVTMVVGLTWEVLFAVVRRMEVNEGFFVTGLLFPLILPATTPLWQAALAISFAVVLAKEVFGGTGMNFVNPALAARAFLFFAYPAQISGDAVWNAAPAAAQMDGVSAATPLAQVRSGIPFDEQAISWWDAFLGFIPGSLGETSALACLIGAVIIMVTGVGSWRTIAAVTLGTVLMATLFNLIGSDTNPWYGVPFWWHMVTGGWAFATAFMVTDPVTSASTNAGKWIWGITTGVLIVLIRVVNPAYPESVMLVILLMNVLAPLIDHGVVSANIRRRRAARE